MALAVLIAGECNRFEVVWSRFTIQRCGDGIDGRGGEGGPDYVNFLEISFPIVADDLRSAHGQFLEHTHGLIDGFHALRIDFLAGRVEVVVHAISKRLGGAPISPGGRGVPVERHDWEPRYQDPPSRQAALPHRARCG
jgi:hypothetical protein